MNYEEFINNQAVNDLLNVLRRKLTARGFNISDADILDEIYSAILAVNSKRRFVPTSNVLFESQYTGLITRLCIASIAKWGAEGETSHSENGINRGYEKGGEYPPSMFSEIVPLGRVKK